MTIDEIKTLIANDEHRTLELKKTTGELKDGMHSACAMLNTEGGWLIFGIAPTWLESWGSGIQRMMDACKAQNVPEPYYKLLADGTIVMVFPISKTTDANFGTDFGTDFGTEGDIQLTERQRIIIDKLLVNGKETAKSISVQFGLTQRSIETDLSFLRKNGYIEKTTKSNNSPWRVLKR